MRLNEELLDVDINRAKALRDELRSLESNIERRLDRSPITVADENAMRDMQVRADGVYQALGRRAPPTTGFERPREYRLRLLEGLKPHSQWKSADLWQFEDRGLDEVERQIFAEARADARCPSDLKPNEVRPIVRQDSAGHGHGICRQRHPFRAPIYAAAISSNL
jgi:hypothetical protein